MQCLRTVTPGSLFLIIAEFRVTGVRFIRSPYPGRLSETFLGAPCLHQYGARHVGTPTNTGAEETHCLLKGEKINK